MNSLADLRPGDIGFGPLSGAARAATLGQAILGEGFHVGTLDIGHVFVVSATDHAYPNSFLPRAVEAMPHGAREVAIGGRWTNRYAYVRLPEDYPGQAADAAMIARAMIGTPYSFASYAALAAWRFGLSTPRLEKWIGRRQSVVTPFPHPPFRGRAIGAQLPCEAICSVLVDQAWSLTGKKIMQDDRPHQCVTPGALAERLLEMTPATVWTFPGR
jgi:hypothetical protein